MNGSQRLERDLPFVLEDLYLGGMPDYRDDLVQRIAATRQRPVWTFPKRWLPMDITTQRLPMSGVPWRAVALVAALALILAAAMAVYVGSQRPTHLPADPFGLAANGVVVATLDGDIVAIDPVTHSTRTIIGGPESDTDPVFSGDGARIAFRRTDDSGGQHLFVANADGSGVVDALQDPVVQLINWTFSPDGQRLLATADVDDRAALLVARSDGSTPAQALDIRLPTAAGDIEGSWFRPPDGNEILVLAGQPDHWARGIYLVDVDGGTLRPIVEPSAPYDVFGATWSPNGEWISYGRYDGTVDGVSAEAWIVAADGSGDRRIDPAPTAADAPMAWSNDSTRLLIGRDPDGDARIAVIGVDPTTPIIELDCRSAGIANCSGDWLWSPDDSTLLGRVPDGTGDRYVLADPDTGVVTETSWAATGIPSWQRVAIPE